MRFQNNVCYIRAEATEVVLTLPPLHMMYMKVLSMPAIFSLVAIHAYVSEIISLTQPMFETGIPTGRNGLS